MEFNFSTGRDQTGKLDPRKAKPRQSGGLPATRGGGGGPPFGLFLRWIQRGWSRTCGTSTGEEPDPQSRHLSMFPEDVRCVVTFLSTGGYPFDVYLAYALIRKMLVVRLGGAGYQPHLPAKMPYHSAVCPFEELVQYRVLNNSSLLFAIRESSIFVPSHHLDRGNTWDLRQPSDSKGVRFFIQDLVERGERDMLKTLLDSLPPARVQEMIVPNVAIERKHFYHFGANNTQTNENSLLKIAVEKDQPGILSDLLSSRSFRCDPNAIVSSAEDTSLLEVAIKSDSLTCTQVILARGGTVNVSGRRSLIDVAVMSQCQRIVSRMKSSLGRVSSNTVSIIRLLLKHGCEHPDCVQLLLDLETNSGNGSNQTVFSALSLKRNGALLKRRAQRRQETSGAKIRPEDLPNELDECELNDAVLGQSLADLQASIEARRNSFSKTVQVLLFELQISHLPNSSAEEVHEYLSELPFSENALTLFNEAVADHFSTK